MHKPKYQRFLKGDLVAHRKTGRTGQIASKRKYDGRTKYSVSGQSFNFDAFGSELTLLIRGAPDPELEWAVHMPRNLELSLQDPGSKSCPNEQRSTSNCAGGARQGDSSAETIKPSREEKHE